LDKGEQMMKSKTSTDKLSPPLGEVSFDPDAPPIWELAAKISAQVPDEEWQKLPPDLAQRFDYYQKQRQKDC
jgi:hypothetical protein